MKKAALIPICAFSFAIMLIGAGCSSQESDGETPVETNYQKYRVDTDALEIDPSDTHQ